MRDATGARFAFLSADVVPTNTYSRVRVTISNTMTLFGKNAASGTSTPLADALPRDSQGRVQVEAALAARTLGASDDIVLDFDLANFAVAGGKVTPVLKEGTKTGLEDASRHESEDYKGTVSNLSGTTPTLTFTLSRPDGTTITVVTAASTAIFNSHAAANPTLANGKVVEVQGIFNPATDRLTASAIKIEDAAGGENSPEIKGKATSIDGTAGTFTLSTLKVEDFVPTQTTVRVVTNSTTVFRSHSGVTLAATEFFTRLTSAQFAEVEGKYDPATNTLTARRAKIEEEEWRKH